MNDDPQYIFTIGHGLNGEPQVLKLEVVPLTPPGRIMVKPIFETGFKKSFARKDKGTTWFDTYRAVVQHQWNKEFERMEAARLVQQKAAHDFKRAKRDLEVMTKLKREIGL